MADWLERAVEAGWITRDGAGFKRDPYRYWLPDREAELRYILRDARTPLLPLRILANRTVAG